MTPQDVQALRATLIHKFVEGILATLGFGAGTIVPDTENELSRGPNAGERKAGVQDCEGIHWNLPTDQQRYAILTDERHTAPPERANTACSILSFNTLDECQKFMAKHAQSTLELHIPPYPMYVLDVTGLDVLVPSFTVTVVATDFT